MVPTEVVVVLGSVFVFAATNLLSVISFHSTIIDQFSEKTTGLLINLSASLFRYIRLIVYFFAFALSLGVLLLGVMFIHDDKARILFYVRSFGMVAFFGLFFTLMPGLIRVYFPRFPLNSLLLRARRAIGQSMFLFALMHGLIAFVYIFSASLDVILNLSKIAQLGVFYDAIALGIFLIMALTSSDFMMKFLTMKVWKMLHRLIYIGVILSTFHAFIRGSHFKEPNSPFPIFMTFFVLTFILFEVGATVIELVRFPKKRHYLKLLPIFITLSIITFISFIVSISELDKMLN